MLTLGTALAFGGAAIASGLAMYLCFKRYQARREFMDC